MEKKPGFYAYFTLILVTLIRSAYVVNKNSIGFAYGFRGAGAQVTDPNFVITVAFPEFAAVYGLVASLMFSAAYCTNNIFMSSLSKNWNKKIMLTIGVMGLSACSLISGGRESLLAFAAFRFLFGLCSSAINVPIYTMIASNFPLKYRSTANSIENCGYWLGNGLASFNVAILK